MDELLDIRVAAVVDICGLASLGRAARTRPFFFLAAGVPNGTSPSGIRKYMDGATTRGESQ
jgi:hypothetical protein